MFPHFCISRDFTRTGMEQEGEERHSDGYASGAHMDVDEHAACGNPAADIGKKGERTVSPVHGQGPSGSRGDEGADQGNTRPASEPSADVD